MRGWKGGRPAPHPKFSTQPWPGRQATEWEKVRGGVEGGGKSLRRKGWWDSFPPTQLEPGKGRIGTGQKAKEGKGASAGPSGDPGASAPDSSGGGVLGRPRRAGRPGRRPRGGAGSLTCRPPGCLLLPPGHRSAPLQSRSWRPGPGPRAGPAVSLAAPGRLRLLPGGSWGVARPRSPRRAPLPLLRHGPETPSLGGRPGGGSCRQVSSRGWFSALFVCLFWIFFSSLFVFAFWKFLVFLVLFFVFFFW